MGPIPDRPLEMLFDCARPPSKLLRDELACVFVGVEPLSEKEAEAQTILYMLPEGIQCGLSLERTVPERPPEGSILMGYDVGNVGWISGLANTEYTEEEIRDLAPFGTNRLNSFGLLETLDDAIAFRQVCDVRDPGSAPF